VDRSAVLPPIVIDKTDHRVTEMIVLDDLPQDLLSRGPGADDENSFPLGGREKGALALPFPHRKKRADGHAQTAGEQEREPSVHQDDSPGIPSLKSIKY
jgi:hypothetical protein